jgi:hypothetical protein
VVATQGPRRQGAACGGDSGRSDNSATGERDLPRINGPGLPIGQHRRLIFITLTGKTIDVPRAEITGVREAKVFKTSVRGARSHLIVQIPTGEIAFYVSSNADWINAIRTVGSGRPT